jgi:hypothetical protein
VAYHRLCGLFGFGEEGVLGQILAVEVGFDGLEIRMFLVITLVPFLVLRNSKFSLTTPFSCFCSRIRLTADVRTIGGGRPGLAGAAASRGVASVLAESVSMSDARGGAKKFRVATSW